LLLKLREFNQKSRARKKKTFARRSLKFDYYPNGGGGGRTEKNRKREKEKVNGRGMKGEKRTVVFINLYEPNGG